MFGYIRINKMDLTFREYEHYKGYYCGLCKYLKRNISEISRFSINYDITFLILLLTSIYQPEPTVTYEKCVVNPIRKKKTIINEITEYAASMNVLLAYHKLEDDIEDDNDLKSKMGELVFRRSYRKAVEKYPEKNEVIKSNLKKLSELEKKNSTNIDELSNTFGNIMAEIFDFKDDSYRENLRNTGFNLGKFVYIIDAYEDIEEDIEKNRFNPFKNIEKDELVKKVDFLCSMTLGHVSDNIEKMNIQVNKAIIDNIIYSGVYLRYKYLLYGEKNREVEKNFK